MLRYETHCLSSSVWTIVLLCLVPHTYCNLYVIAQKGFGHFKLEIKITLTLHKMNYQLAFVLIVRHTKVNW